MEHIGAWSNFSSCLPLLLKPTLRHRVFTRVFSWSLFGSSFGRSPTSSQLIISQPIMGDVGVSVANGHTVIQNIGCCKGAPNTIESARPVFNLLELYSLIFPIDNLEESRLQSFTTLAIGSLIVGACVVRSLCPGRAESKDLHRDGHVELLHIHSFPDSDFTSFYSSVGSPKPSGRRCLLR